MEGDGSGRFRRAVASTPPFSTRQVNIGSLGQWLEQQNAAMHHTSAKLLDETAGDVDLTANILFTAAKEAAMRTPEVVNGELNPDGAEDIAIATEAELQFWLSVQQRGFQVPTNGKLHAIAGRWARRLKSDPELKARPEELNRPSPTPPRVAPGRVVQGARR
eukprot:1138288-Pyramimonas_sp.AAC.1